MPQPQHGYYMTVCAIATLNESHDELSAFQDLYLKRFEPQDPVQLFLVETMFESHLNLRRVARWKAGAMESLARECRNRARNDGMMFDDGAVHNGDILEKAIRLEQRTLVNDDCRHFSWPSRGEPELKLA